MRKFSRFQFAEPDCKAQLGEIVVRVYRLESEKPKIEYNLKKIAIPEDIKAAVKVWVKHQKFGGLSLQQFLEITLAQAPT